MNILCIDQFAENGGAQRCLTELLPAFIDCGWQTHVAAPAAGGFLAIARELGAQTHLFKVHCYTNGRKSMVEIARYGHDLIRVSYAILDLASNYKLNLLYVNGPRFLPPAAVVARFKSVPLIFHCHNRVVQPAALAALRASLRLAHANVIACCKYVAEPFQRHLPPGQLSIIYNGVSAKPVFRTQRSRNRRTIGVIGRIEEEKGQLEFVLAAHAVAERCPECMFVVVGAPLFSTSGYLDRVIEASHGLPIQFPGWRDDIATVLSSLDLLVVPSSRIDATTRVVVEAFAAGVPVVAFPSGGIPEVLIDEETGFLAADHTAQALADRIVSVLKMPAERLRFIVDLARKRWRENYTPHAYRERVISVIREVADRNLSQRSPWTTLGNNVHA